MRKEEKGKQNLTHEASSEFGRKECSNCMNFFRIIIKLNQRILREAIPQFMFLFVAKIAPNYATEQKC